MSARLRLLLSISLAALGLTVSCRPSIQELCDQRLSQFEVEVTEYRVALQAAESAAGRGLASLGTDGDEDEEDARDRWKEWAIDRLSLAQTAMDVTEERAELREAHRAANEVATLLVTFSSYAEMGKTKRMRETLEKLAPRFERFRAVACE